MSENLTGTTETEEVEVEETTETATPRKTWRERLGEITDGSRVADLAAVASVVETIQTLGANALQVWNTLTPLIKGIAQQEANVRAFILTQDGSPDWQGSTAAYKAVAEETLNEVFGDLPKNERNNLTSRIRQHVNRTYRELAIVAYVAAMERDGELLFPGILDETGSPDPAHEGYDAFKAMVRRQYLNSNIAVPSAFQTTADRAAAGTGGGGGNAGGNDALSVLARSGEVFKDGKARDDLLAASLLENVSAFVLNIANPRRDGGIANREVVGAFLHRIADVALIGAKACDNVLTAKDREGLSESAWNAETDPASLRKDDEQ